MPGHFPGNPLVPGVVILDEVMQCIRRQLGDVSIQALPNVKFLAPLRAGVEVSVTVEEKKTALLAFTCRTVDSVICSGQVRIND